MNKSILALVIFAFINLICKAQNSIRHKLPPADGPVNNETPKIEMKPIENNGVQFSTTLRPLIQVPGAPKPYYTYFWEFGDGTFSDATTEGKKPVHLYKTSGIYQVRLYATNNYDNGKAPVTIPQPFTIQLNSSANTSLNSNFFSKEDKNRNIKMKLNRKPKPDEDLVAYIGYRNLKYDNFGGSLVVFFNDAKFYRKIFSLEEKRTYYGEENSSLDLLLSRLQSPDTHKMLKALQKQYKEGTVLHFNNLQRNEERFFFLAMRTFSEMIRDTNAVITMRAVLVPDDPSLKPELFELESPIVKSHDPNRMLLAESRINYRFMKKKKELNYTVQFQNIGEGASNNISVGIGLPRQLKVASLKVKEISPGSGCWDSLRQNELSCVDTLTTADSIYFIFKNIYLPGLKQNLVRNDDSTQGFVKYSILFKKRPKKIPFSSRAVIVFDKNEPVYTNNATATFVKGLSPGIVAGYNLSLSNGKYSARGPIQIGYVLAPYAPSKPYFQIEVHAGILQQEDSIGKIEKLNRQSVPQGIISLNYSTIIGQKEIIWSKKQKVLQVVPLHFRYNLDSWIGLGIGMMGQIIISEQTKSIEKYYLKIGGNRPFDTVITRTNSPKTERSTKVLSKTNIASFADIQIGRVRTGPTLGLRYIRQWQGNIRNRFFMYAGFKL